ncbi:RNA polymerase sigma factor [Pelagicoccus mobilis]|uniref:RNA polymerase sigma factor n=1 Tax=Pelagicoccus mobilis TaxID=415221 RepID=A0A934VPK7_9BACT|nr:RNA polymerase sigma factor [Pelagicoccus mobilis]MBK1875629.1 RNA polymerase sigma factor [Pelagicoccus mobilis]
MSEQDAEHARWFVEEVLPHQGELQSWLSRRYPTIADPDDLVQDAFSRILKAHSSGPIANPRAFLYVTARNLALNKIRHLRYERPQGLDPVDPLTIVDDSASPSETTALSEELQHLIQAIQNLPERCRQVMTLRKIYGLSQKEVARKLGISVNTVEAQSAIGLRKCIAYFRSHGYLTRYSK